MKKENIIVISAGAAVGLAAIALTLLGNPANMGFCIACFLRDTAGGLGLHRAAAVQYIRPEIIGLVLGSFGIALFKGEFSAKGGSAPLTRFVLGFFVMIGCLMFLGCPFRMILRLAGGDLNALLGGLGFVLGILAGVFFLKKGYSLKRSYSMARLEGFLFPKTYAVTEDMDAEAVVRMMLDQFGTETASIFGDFANSYPASQGLTLYQAVNLASIVAKESTGDQEVRDHVAGVFYNRLASDRPYLESDATTAYEVGREPTAEEVHAETPYSTYANAGLPPTPICSPGLESLTAVCEPTQTEDMFFYFYPDADGNMQAAFSKTYEEHQQAIADNSNAGGADGSGDAAAGEGAAA